MREVSMQPINLKAEISDESATHSGEANERINMSNLENPSALSIE
jgi:hypothetical protein